MSNFNKWMNILEDMNMAPDKAMDIIPSEGASGYSYYDKIPYYRKHKGLVYFIYNATDDEIVKIGQTDATLSSRFSSYCAGTQTARDKGTCSVTNYYLSEEIRNGFKQGKKFSVYALPVTKQEISVNVGNKEVRARAKVAYVFEDVWLKLYTEVFGLMPRLSKNTSER
jgi:hypothetical protein